MPHTTHARCTPYSQGYSPSPHMSPYSMGSSPHPICPYIQWVLPSLPICPHIQWVLPLTPYVPIFNGFFPSHHMSPYSMGSSPHPICPHIQWVLPLTPYVPIFNGLFPSPHIHKKVVPPSLSHTTSHNMGGLPWGFSSNFPQFSHRVFPLHAHKRVKTSLTTYLVTWPLTNRVTSSQGPRTPGNITTYNFLWEKVLLILASMGFLGSSETRKTKASTAQVITHRVS